MIYSKVWILLVGLFSTLFVRNAQAADGHMGLTANLTYASKYLTDGFKIGGDNPVMEPSIDLKVFSTGFSLMLWTALQLNRENRRYDELDFFVRYSHDFFGSSSAAMNLHAFWDYWYFPQSHTRASDWYGNRMDVPNMRGNKLGVGVSFPKMLSVAGSYLVPIYNFYYWFYWVQNRKDLYQGGAHHEALLYYDHAIPVFIPGALTQYIGFTGSVNYNDGAFGVRPGWSHTTAQIATSIYFQDFILTGTINRQWTHQASVDPDNELWFSLSVMKKF